MDDGRTYELSMEQEPVHARMCGFGEKVEPPFTTATVLDTVTSEPFEIFPAKRFPGMNKSTPLSKKLFEQGVRIPLRKDTRVGRSKQLVQTDAENGDELED
ncbi:MAG: hypothetical protein J3Q66DRAFT_372219 [Benniella sp.]|nr:MAG: hypothetical protein J3Q66DRAFT_372219 [Benniella sp.]